MKILRRWTDVDGIACTDLNGDSEISPYGLKELLSLGKFNLLIVGASNPNV